MNNRIRAFLIHLLLSAMIAGIVMALVFGVWYPAPLHEAVGVSEIFLLLISIDMMIGPVITLIIYKPNKPSLKFDLAVIACLQLGALSYGVNTMFQGRPAYVVFSVDRFDLARASDIDPASAGKAQLNRNPLASPGWMQPRWVGAVESSDTKRRQEILFSSLQGGPDWPLLPELYVPLGQMRHQILAKAKPMQKLRDLHHNDASVAILAHWKDGEVKWLPLRGTMKNMVVLVDAATAAVIKILDIDPWYGATK